MAILQESDSFSFSWWSYRIALSVRTACKAPVQPLWAASSLHAKEHATRCNSVMEHQHKQLMRNTLWMLAADANITNSFCITVLSQIQISSVPVSVFLLLLCSLSLTLVLYQGIALFPLLSSYLSAVSICGMSDRFGSWFRRCEAGSISRVSVYSSWVMTLTAAVWSEHLLHLNNVVLDTVCLDAWRPCMPVALQPVEISQHMQREVLQIHRV